jgi:hypothetical protein
MRTPSSVRTWIVTAATALGVSVGVAGLAGAATSGSTTTAPAAATATATPAATTPAAPATGAAVDPATVDHGPGETLLTGDAAAKVTAAAKAAVPGATIIRVETDSGGAAYEAHLTKADGSQATVKLDSNFKVTATQDGFGAGGPGHGADNGTAGA